MSVRFQPAGDGGALALCSASTLLVFGVVPDAALLDSAWAAVGEATGFQSLLDLLTRNGLTATPPFVLVDWSGASAEVRVIVRGDLTVTVNEGKATSTLSGTGVSTWVERILPADSSLSVVVPGAVAIAAAGVLTVREGTVWVASVELGPGDRAASASASASASSSPSKPAAEPVAAAAPPVAAPPVAAPPLAAASHKAAAPAQVSPAPAVATPAATPEIDIEATRTEMPVEATIVSAPESAATPQEDSSPSYDYLFGDTVFRSVADAAVPEHSEEPAASASEVDESTGGDHDGHTVLTSDIAKLRAGRKKRAASEPAAAAQEPVAPSIVLAVSTGAREPLIQPVLVGRSPSVSKVSGGQMPRLLVVGGADQDISRNHAQFALEGGTVVVTDLHSRNGTMVTLPGKEPQKLRAGEPTSVLVGTVVDLGGGITLTVNEE